MSELPTLETERLLLRPFELGDAPTVQRLAGDRDIAATTLNVPHPYEDGMAEQWIATHRPQWDAGASLQLAIVALREVAGLVGAIGLTIHPEHDHAELGYWIAKPAWNRGYCTEASRALVAYAFDTLGLNRIHAHHFGSNPASGAVMRKLGMRYEGRLRQHVKKWDRFEDIEMWATLRADPR